MKLYRRALEIQEDLSDLLGKASTIAMMAQIDAMQEKYRAAMVKLLDAMNITIQVGADLHMQNLVGNIKMLQSMMKFEEFGDLYGKINGTITP